MSSNVNRPTGLGFQGSPYRTCTLCHHLESTHYSHRCHAMISIPDLSEFDPCPCNGFAGRELDEAEKIILEAGRIEAELEYVGEAMYTEIKREAGK